MGQIFIGSEVPIVGRYYQEIPRDWIQACFKFIYKNTLIANE